MDASVVVPTYNRKDSLIRCLRSLPSDVEIVVVDDGSTDGTSRAISSIRHPNLKYVRQENGGPASARNYGARVCTGRYIAFTDDDCIAVEPWPWPLIRRLEKEGETVAGVGGRVLPFGSGVFSRYYTFHRILEPPNSCSYLVTANCAYRRGNFESVGGFDTSIKQAGGEDPGLSMKIRATGHYFAFESGAIVMHDYKENLFDFAKRFYRYGKGCAYVMGKRTETA